MGGGKELRDTFWRGLKRVRPKRVQGLVPAGSLRVSLSSLYSPPPRLGARGLKQSVTDPLYHACVGMADVDWMMENVVDPPASGRLDPPY
jgi:hypothetical protein